MSLAEIKADCKLNRDRIKGIDLSKVKTVEDLAKWIKFELLEQVFPLVEATVDATETEFADVDQAVSALADLVDADDEEGLNPETAEQILAVFNLGKQLCAEFEPLLVKADEIKRKRLKGILRAYRKAAEVVGGLVASIVIVDDEPDAPGQPANDGPPDPTGDGAIDDDRTDVDDVSDLADDGMGG